MKNIILFCLFFSFLFNLNAQIVTIPDANFKAALVADLGINTNGDSEIQVSEANTFSGYLDVSNKSIADLTGIEAFVNITTLNCQNNLLTTLNVSNSPNLTELACSVNQLTSLDVSGNGSLLTLTANLNQLSTINLNNNTALVTLKIQFNLLSSINLNNNVNLITFEGSNNPFTTLSISSGLNLETLIFENTQINSLDLSSQTSLTILWLDSNNLTTLNLQNGNNPSIFSFRSFGNPNLTCIQVDNAAWSTSNWTNIDATASFNTNCSVGINEQKEPINVSVYPNPANDFITIAVNSSQSQQLTIEIIDVTGKIVFKQILTTPLSTINIADLSKGYYNVFFKDNREILSTKKLIIN